MNMTVMPPRAGTRRVVAREDWTFPWYIGGALVTALVGGFVLAVLLPLAVVLDWRWGTRWRALVQVHGHLQIVGWLGLFIAGMALRLAPRFAGRPLWLGGATPVALILLAVGLLGRAVAQPWLDLPGMDAVLMLSAVAELAGAALVAAALAGTLLPVARTLPSAPLLLLGAVGMTVQATLSALWLPDLTAAYPVLPPDRNGAVLAIQFYAFVLPVVLGVSLRALPTFFKRPATSVRRAWVLTAGLGAGAALYAGARLLAAGAAGVRLEQAGALLIAVTTVTAIVQLGVWRPPERLRPAARPVVLLIRTAYCWLALAALWLAVVAMHALWRGAPVPPAHADAVRHVLALGVFTTLLVGMAHLMLPWLAMRRLPAAGAHREIRALWALLTAAAVLRVLGAVMETRGVGPERYWPMAVGGVFAMTALIAFAVSIIRAARVPPPEIRLEVKDR